MFIEVIQPWLFMAASLVFVPITIFKCVGYGNIRPLLSYASFKEAWFGNFWVYMGPMAKQGAEPFVVPLLEGRIRNGRVTDDPGKPIEGVVLEIGAGSGMWTDTLAHIVRAAKAESLRGPTKIYGVEPNPMSAATLARRVQQTGMGDTYEVVPVGIEDLQNEAAWGGRIDSGSVDCIMTVQCLCSIPEPEKNVRILYDYLKKGGRWYVYEHVKAERGLVIPLFQRFTNMFWEHAMGSCHLCRRTEQTLRNVGKWEEVDLAQPAEETTSQVIPHIVGVLTK
ncbi:Methyltransferase-like protein 7B [Colletotrichum sidae]|uniref:Methyltransferase-like protein 7B n=1 Tax=Colletotrichum sidae TaxID=1347389 RepID=A0A4R8TKG4_9PEZI|nr:Methyltransferase-like protein 7B [Colletotrichum sidae]